MSTDTANAITQALIDAAGIALVLAAAFSVIGHIVGASAARREGR